MSLFKKGALSFFIVFFLAACCLAVPAYFIYRNASRLVTSQVSNNAIDIAASVASFVGNDIDQFNSSPVYVYAPETGDFLPHPSGEAAPGSSDGIIDDVYDGMYDGSDGSEPGGAASGDMFDELFDSEPGGAYNGLSSGGAIRSSGITAVSATTSGSFADTEMVPGNSETEPDELDEEYLDNISSLLDRIRTETGAANIYIEKKVSDMHKGYMLKPDAVTSQNISSDMTSEELKVFNDGIKSSSDVMSDDTLGEYLRGYAPIYDTQSSQPMGVVVVEFLLADAVNLMSGVRRIIIGHFTVIYLLVTFVVYRLLTTRAKYLFTDYLTALSNKRYFERQLKKVIRHARETNQPLSLMMIDIDHFKSINDTMGHAMGDTVLKTVSATLRRCTRRSDACCRFGGDEFAMILPHATGAQAAAIAERVRQETAKLLFTGASGPFGVTLSIGVAEFAGDMTSEEFIELADRTMYVSKNSGKNRTTVYGWCCELSPEPQG